MNETALRWRARIGGLKWLTTLVLILAVIFFIIEIGALTTALNNPDEPEAATVQQLVDGAIDTGRYVTVSGYAVYDAGYEKTEDSRTVATYYLLLDDVTGHLVAVKAPAVIKDAPSPESVTVSGMTRGTPSELNSLIRSDMPTFEQAGFATTSTLYLAEGQKPPSESGVLLILFVLGIVAVVCVVPFFFPSVVFAPRPPDPTVTPALSDKQRAGVKATGRFVQLKQLQPTIEIGKRSQKFGNAVANIIPLGQSNLLVYIHHVVRTKAYGVVTVSKQESDWGAFISGDKVLDIEPGKLYGWKDRLAVRFRYQGPKNKPETLFVTFDDAAGQAGLVQLLQQMGFAVGPGM